MVQCNAIRSQAPGYPGAGAFPDPVTRLIDEERRQQFEREGTHFESEYFLTLTHLPPYESEERVRGWAFEGGTSPSNKLALQAVDRFRRPIDHFEDTFRRIFTAERLRRNTVTDDFGFTRVFDDLLRYYRRCLTHVCTFWSSSVRN
jgi:type IV secretion system protein TrbE